MKKQIITTFFAFIMMLGIASAEEASSVSQPIELEPGIYNIGEDILSGWYRIYRIGEEDASIWLYTGNALDSKSEKVTGHTWFGSNNDADGNIIPLVDDCAVHVGTSTTDERKIVWKGTVKLEYISPIINQSSTASDEKLVEKDPYLLYEDENLSISYSDFFVETVGDNSYIKTELLLKNKTNKILNIGCDAVVLNGCTVDISKFVEVPANCTYLHQWTNNAEMFMKYHIESIETFGMLFEYHNADSVFAGKTIQTDSISIKSE